MTKMNFLKKAALLSGVAMLSLSATAQAGFEWRGPIEPPRAPVSAPMVDHQMTPPRMVDEPAVQQEDMQEMEPLTAWDGDMAPQPVAQDSAPVMTAGAALPAASTMNQGEVISGFGSDLPLVIALQQVVPPGYQYSFASGVSAGVSVSWEGGKPWQQVLTDMLSGHGLSYRVQGNTVVIGIFAPALPQEAQYTPSVYTPSPMPSDSAAMPAQEAEDLAPVMISSASRAEQLPESMTAAPADQAQAQDTMAPVSIRRQKPSSLLERLGWARDDSGTENIAVPRSNDEAMSPAPESAGMMPPALSTPPEPMMSAKSADSSEKTEGTQMAAATSMSAAPQMTTPPSSGMVTNAIWGGAKGQTLRDVLKAWSDKEGVELYWSIDYDYRLSDNVGYTGGYDEAVGSLLDQFASVRPQPYGQLHQNSSGPRVLVVKSYDLTR